MPAVLEMEQSEEHEELGGDAISHAYSTLRNTGAKLVKKEGSSQLPPSFFNFLIELIKALAAKQSVAIIHSESTFTTVQAAQMLGVSRQHLVNLLESGKMPFHKVGNHRRIYAGDLLEYKAKRDQNRKKAIDAFSDLEMDQYLDQ
jgi:excisionase family DNA binding protein